MKVKCLRSFSGMSFNGTIGEVKDFPDAIAEDLIKAGYAKEAVPSVATSQQKAAGTKVAKEEAETASEKEVTDESKRNNSRKAAGTSKRRTGSPK